MHECRSHRLPPVQWKRQQPKPSDVPNSYSIKVIVSTSWSIAIICDTHNVCPRGLISCRSGVRFRTNFVDTSACVCSTYILYMMRVPVCVSMYVAGRYSAMIYTVSRWRVTASYASHSRSPSINAHTRNKTRNTRIHPYQRAPLLHSNLSSAVISPNAQMGLPIASFILFSATRNTQDHRTLLPEKMMLHSFYTASNLLCWHNLLY